MDKKNTLPKPTGSTWEAWNIIFWFPWPAHSLQANLRAADSRAHSRATVTPLDLSDYDVCSESGWGLRLLVVGFAHFGWAYVNKHVCLCTFHDISLCSAVFL